MTTDPLSPFTSCEKNGRWGKISPPLSEIALRDEDEGRKKFIGRVHCTRAHLVGAIHGIVELVGVNVGADVFCTYAPTSHKVEGVRSRCGCKFLPKFRTAVVRLSTLHYSDELLSGRDGTGRDRDAFCV